MGLPSPGADHRGDHVDHDFKSTLFDSEVVDSHSVPDLIENWTLTLREAWQGAPDGPGGH